MSWNKIFGRCDKWSRTNRYKVAVASFAGGNEARDVTGGYYWSGVNLHRLRGL